MCPWNGRWFVKIRVLTVLQWSFWVVENLLGVPVSFPAFGIWVQSGKRANICFAAPLTSSCKLIYTARSSSIVCLTPLLRATTSSSSAAPPPWPIPSPFPSGAITTRRTAPRSTSTTPPAATPPCYQATGGWWWPFGVTTLELGSSTATLPGTSRRV